MSKVEVKISKISPFLARGSVHIITKDVETALTETYHTPLRELRKDVFSVESCIAADDECLDSIYCGCYDLSNAGFLINYIDYERFGRDIHLESNGNFTSYGYVERV